MGAVVSFFLFLYPFLRTEFAPCGNRAQNDFFADRQREILRETARKIPALVATFVAFFGRARFDRTREAKLESHARQAALAGYIVGRAVVNRAESFLEFLVVVPMGYQNSAHAAIQSAGRKQFLFYAHGLFLLIPLIPGTRSGIEIRIPVMSPEFHLIKILPQNRQTVRFTPCYNISAF